VIVAQIPPQRSSNPMSPVSDAAPEDTAGCCRHSPAVTPPAAPAAPWRDALAAVMPTAPAAPIISVAPAAPIMPVEPAAPILPVAERATPSPLRR
jgi:hypothetical protein